MHRILPALDPVIVDIPTLLVLSNDHGYSP